MGLETSGLREWGWRKGLYCYLHIDFQNVLCLCIYVCDIADVYMCISLFTVMWMSMWMYGHTEVIGWCRHVFFLTTTHHVCWDKTRVPQFSLFRYIASHGDGLCSFPKWQIPVWLPCLYDVYMGAGDSDYTHWSVCSRQMLHCLSHIISSALASGFFWSVCSRGNVLIFDWRFWHVRA